MEDETNVNLHLEALRTIGRRSENSQSEKNAIAYISRVCDSAGLRIMAYPLARSGIGHSYSALFGVAFPGSISQSIVIAVPLNNSLTSETGEGDAGIALALAAIESISSERNAGRQLPISISFIFIGAEGGDSSSENERSGYGSISWITAMQETGTQAIVYLSFDSLPGSIELQNYGGGQLSPYWYYERSRAALAASGFKYRLNINRMQAARLGLSTADTRIAPFLAADIPAVGLKTINDAIVSPKDAEKCFLLFINALIKLNAGGFLEAWDRHYLGFQIGKYSFVLREGSYITILIIYSCTSVALLLFGTVFKKNKGNKELMHLGLLTFQILIFYSIATLAYLCSSLLTGFESWIFGSAQAWRLAPQAFAAARFLGIFFFMLLIISALISLKFLSPNPYFYEFASFLFLVIDVLIFTAIAPPFAFYFVWASLWVGVSFMLKKPVASLIAYALMYVPVLLLVYEFAARPDYELYNRLMNPGTKVAFLMAAATLPANVFTASPLLFYRPHKEKGRKIEIMLFAFAIIAIESLAIIMGTNTIDRCQVDGPASFDFSEHLDQDKGNFIVTLHGNRRIGRVTLDRGGSILQVESQGDKAVFQDADLTKWISFAEERTFFLDRSLIKMRITFTRPPFRVSIWIESTEDLNLYDCSMPYKVSIDGHRVDIFIGANPPNPLMIELAASHELSGILSVDAEYPAPLVRYSTTDGTPIKPKEFSLHASTTVGGARE